MVMTIIDKLLNEKGFSIVDFQHLENEGEKVSSSKIRNWILEGNFPQTTRALNRYYSINGVITHGDSRGKKIGFPTANLEIWKGSTLQNPQSWLAK